MAKWSGHSSKREAVEAIAEMAMYHTTAHAAREALKEGTEQAYTRALVIAREHKSQAVVTAIANEQLGFKKDE